MELRGEDYRRAIDACGDAAVACEAAAEACIEMGGLQPPLRASRDCIGLCSTAMNFLARGSQLSGDLCAVTARSCDLVAESCRELEIEALCKAAEACAECARACRVVASAAYVA